HEVLAGILVEAVLAGEAGDARSAATQIARARGQDLGTAERTRLRPGRLGPERALTLAGEILADRGFEPQRTAPTGMLLRNCPFHPLAARAPALVCGINHAYLSGLLEGLGAETVEALLDPRPACCCVRLAGAVR
ncbi:MAG: transcriptional regulator, partial [Actinobacteria bacterium]|nr:transcriptional regulator [Actinomycetota bacterium]